MPRHSHLPRHPFEVRDWKKNPNLLSFHFTHEEKP